MDGVEEIYCLIGFDLLVSQKKKDRRNEKELIFRSPQAQKKNLIPTCLVNGPMSAGKAPTKKCEKKSSPPFVALYHPKSILPALDRSVVDQTCCWWNLLA